MNTLVSFTILVAVVVTVIGIVGAIIFPLIDTMTVSAEIDEAMLEMKSLDMEMREVIRGGKDVSRMFYFTGPQKFEVFPEEDAIQYQKSINEDLFEYFSRSLRKNMIFIAGADVDCREEDGNGDGTKDLVLENTYVKFVFKRVPEVSPWASIDTTDNIILMQEKTYNMEINITNSSILIDDNITTASGTGYSEILRTGVNKPECTVHFFVNSTQGTDYDVYYKLYAGADFLVIDVRNI